MYLNISKTMDHHLFIFIFGLFTLFMHTTSAVNVEHFTLFKEKLTLKAHTINIIPCMFQTRGQLNPLKVQLEWGKMDSKGYTSLIHLYGEHATMESPDLKDKYHLFESQVAKGICSLVINPTEMKDSGTYEVRLKILGKLYEPVPSIEIQVENQVENKDTDESQRGFWSKSQTTTVPPTTTTASTATAAATVSFQDAILEYINSSAKGETIHTVILGALLVIGIVLLLIAVKLCTNGRQKNPDSDEENPPDNTSKKGKDKKKKKKEKSESEKSSNESEESTSTVSEESESD
ncbi:uncharacterized protein LOC121396509 isoform X1 [Xenopus laevis]|uniref:Uncharacterized protein LOC121396506 isoform X1 n=2 Tax=Xenopus laevis TaxID=8355 RepID=A0A8J1LCW1_XENLA|nr:uncharacterized protein LOC121396506 isoform X1 [Xenopus laevis]XP_041427393.1 uncharacterized protein LOC121396509 isoform X1 [Xenopus laevis]